MPKDENTCNVKFCRNPGNMTYLEKRICNTCWFKYADGPQMVLWRKLGITKAPKSQEEKDG